MRTSTNLNPGIISTTTATLIVNNTTGSNLLFKVVGSVKLLALWGEVTTVLSSNITAAHYRLNDQTAQPAISLATGTVLSSAAVGSIISRGRLAATALTFLNAAAATITEASAVNLEFFSPCILQQKTGGVQTDIEFRYTTTNAPSTGVIQFYALWLPISGNGSLVGY